MDKVERHPGEGRYAHLEREQRWVLTSVPPRVNRFAAISDRYLIDTQLRLRKVQNDVGTVYKFTQKIRVDPADPVSVKITNIYVSEAEYLILSAIPAAEVRKTRWTIEVSGHDVAVDEFHGRHGGLVLAEVELEPNEEFLPMPPFAVREVTHDNRYSGGYLAFATDDELAAQFERFSTNTEGGQPTPS